MFARKYVGKDLTTQSKSRVIKYKKIMCDIYNKLIKLKVSIYIEKKTIKMDNFPSEVAEIHYNKHLCTFNLISVNKKRKGKKKIIST